jgi:hypothetical protein
MGQAEQETSQLPKAVAPPHQIAYYFGCAQYLFSAQRVATTLDFFLGHICQIA